MLSVFKRHKSQPAIAIARKKNAQKSEITQHHAAKFLKIIMRS
jgi:hypothetical protein